IGLFDNGSATNCYVNGNWLGVPNTAVSGLTGGGSLDSCLVEGQMRSGVSSQVAGLASRSASPISNSKANLDIVAPNSQVSALINIGYNLSAYQVTGHEIN